MRAALLIGIAALLMLGCGAAEYKNKVTSQNSPAYASNSAVASVSSPAAAMGDPAANPVYQSQERNRPSEHEMAVHKFHAQKKARARNNDYWSVQKVSSDRKTKEAIDMIKKRKEALASGGQVGEPGPSMILTEKRKKAAMRRLRQQREAVMNGLGDVVANTKNRLDLKPSRLNSSRMPGNGLVGMQPHDRYISKEECPHQSCINKALTSRSKYEQLGNVPQH
jgi:hypothetical protein